VVHPGGFDDLMSRERRRLRNWGNRLPFTHG
jgi:hypothetical protein